MKRIAIIGAGIAGTACAYECQKKGHDVTLFDKSRGVSGRSTTKRWDTIAGIGIDMGVPYIEESHVSSISRPLINHLIEERVLSIWPLSLHSKGALMSIKALVGSPKMSQVTRFLSNDIRLISTQRIESLMFNGAWSLHAQENVYDGYDLVILALPAEQVTQIKGVPIDIYDLATTISYGAINTLLIEMKSPLWFDDFEEDRVDGPIIQTIIADYLKPNRVLQRFTYAVHSQPSWATKRFDELTKDAVEEIMLDSLLKHYHRKRDLVLNTLTHQWKYGKLMGAKDSLQRGFLTSEDSTVLACGDWCNGHTMMSAMESGLLLAKHIEHARH